jgi:hypothetical protein
MTAALAVVAPRIGQLIRLLGSDQDGEVLAAARALGRTLTSVGADFHTLADTIERAAPAARHECEDHRAIARWLLDRGALLSRKELSFVADMANRFGSLSTRQEAWLQAIYERVSAQSRRA